MDKVIDRLEAAQARYVLIGGQAIRLEGMPRFSMDWDLYIPPRDTANIARINAALADELDVPLEPLGPKGENFVQTYQTPAGILQFHLGGPGLPPFDVAEREAVTHVTENGTRVRCMSAAQLLQTKRASNRPQDADDIRFLEVKAAQEAR
jgi:hypothetical protein